MEKEFLCIVIHKFILILIFKLSEVIRVHDIRKLFIVIKTFKKKKRMAYDNDNCVSLHLKPLVLD